MVDEPAATPLERAMNLYFAAVDSGSDVRGLAHEHPDLRELLEPMIDGAAAGEPADADETVGGYHLLRELGRGGMGIVYEAWEAALDRKVAMKLISPALVADASAVARFRREAAGAGRLRHPGIVEVLQFGVDAGKHFFVMELVDGPSLHACRSRFRDVPAAVALARQVLEALQHAHERGLVHRDVKPANILIRADGRAVVTDFGLASDSSLPSLTQAGAFLGTLD
ncbi:MAG TPA: serine/threonine-protein kinase, partial [Planctomycetota bacterium]|nr:serine/threonine-protein kinase [Planctomycetota bacterium]